MPPPWQSKEVLIKIIYQDILTVLADATNDLSKLCPVMNNGLAPPLFIHRSSYLYFGEGGLGLHEGFREYFIP